MKRAICFLIIIFQAAVQQVKAQAASPQVKSQIENQAGGYRLEAVGPATATAAITASEYCEFLNAVAATDSQNLYDEKMESDLVSGCVTRVGAPGSYVYEVLVGKENNPITFLSFKNAALYYNWLSNKAAKDSSSTSTFNFNSSVDYQLTSNQLTFQVVNLTAASNPTAASNEAWSNRAWEEALAEFVLGSVWVFVGEGEETEPENPVLSALPSEQQQHSNTSYFFAKAVEAHLVGTAEKMDEATSWLKAGLCSQLADHQNIKVFEAISAENEILAINWNDIMQENIKASEFYEQSAKSYAMVTSIGSGAGDGWYWAAEGRKETAERAKQIIEAILVNDYELATSLIEAAAECEERSRSYEEAWAMPERR